MNIVFLIGNLGETPIVRNTADGTAVTTFSLATSKRWKDKSGVKQEKTAWHKIQAWGQNATNCAAYLKKGSKLQVTGHNDVQPWTDKAGIDRRPTFVVMDSMEMLGDPGHQRGETANTPPPPANIPPPPAQPAGPTYEQLITKGWTAEQIAAQPEYAHLKPAVANTGQQGFHVPEEDIPF